ncbi:MAG: HAMP domain-containing sensor histidine kinase [Andreesenia angusta]|nr:HAMP domain-containing sensor histidine kinase [Andreesenia angusta]
MKIKNKIIFSNIGTIIITGTIMIIILIILMISFKNLTGLNIKSLRTQKYNLKNIERNIDIYMSRIEYAQTEDIKKEHYNSLKKYLSRLNYKIMYIGDSNEILDSNLDDEDFDFLNNIEYLEKNYNKMNTLIIDGKNIIKKDIRNNISEKNAYIVAIGNTNHVDLLDFELIIETFIAYMILFLVTALFLLFLSNMISARYTASYILNPLERLKYGTEKIRNGEYEYTIYYPNEDEFGLVISEFNDMKEKLRVSEKQKEIAEKDRRELIAGISHDLRTPLTSIKGYAKGLLDGIADTDQKKDRYIETIYRKTEELERLINILYLYSRLESGSMNFNFEEIEFTEYIRDIIEDLSNYREKNIFIRYKGIDNEKIFISIDRSQFERIIFNIVENSSKYARDDEDEELDIEFKLYRDDLSLYLAIKDSGKGVDEDKLDKIFDVFYRADSSRKNSSDSSGLGLSIVKRIIEGHNGQIYAKNENGLVIIIKLPIRRIL